MTSAFLIADAIISISNAKDIAIDNLRLQKLLYFLEKEWILKDNDLLFSEEFEAFRYGPVVRGVWKQYSCFGGANIVGKAYNSTLSEEVYMFICNFVDSYRNIKTWDLVEQSHKDIIWEKAFRSQSKMISSYELIKFVRKI